MNGPTKAKKKKIIYKPSRACKLAGFKSLKEVSEITGRSLDWLIRNFKNDRPLFDSEIDRAKNLKND